MGIFYGAFYVMVFGVIVLGGVGVLIAWCMATSKLLEAIPESSRTMKPTQPYLTLIPLFGYVWQFMVVNAVAKSMANEFERRQAFSTEPKPGYNLGLTGSILICCMFIPGVAGLLLGLTGIIIMLIYTFRVHGFVRMISTGDGWEESVVQQTSYAQPEIKKEEPTPYIPPASTTGNYDKYMPPQPGKTNDADGYDRWKPK
jgi:hypothetical protein